MTSKVNEALEGTYVTLARLLKDYNLDFRDFCQNLQKHYVFDIYKTSYTFSRTALRSNVDRRFVSDIINNRTHAIKTPKLLNILIKIENKAKLNNMKLNKMGANSVESIMGELVSGATTLNSIIVELLVLGCIKDCGEHIEFIANRFDISNQELKNLSELSDQLESQFTNVNVVNTLK